MNIGRLSSLLATLFVGLVACQAQDGYGVVNKFPVPGDGHWDLLAVDDATGRVFLSHGMETDVVDGSTGKLLATIPDTKGVHGIAIASEEQKGFISCGKDSSVIVFDLASYKVLAHVKVNGASPDAIIHDPFSHDVVVFNGHSSNATVIDAGTNAVVTDIALPGKPELAVSDGQGHVYVNLEDKSMVCAINASSWKVEHTWSLAPGEGPSGLALDNATHRLFANCDNKLMVVMDAQSGEVVTTLPIGDHVDGAAFDPGTKRAFAPNGEGTLTVVQEDGADRFHVLATVPTQPGARTIAIDLRTHHLFLPTAEFGPKPEPTREMPRPRPALIPGSFVLLDVAAVP
ncbi:MAG: YncE family protein [Bacteroidetes bacterium]|nr:YncE family protein [Bacteroidota bacterium]